MKLYMHEYKHKGNGNSAIERNLYSKLATTDRVLLNKRENSITKLICSEQQTNLNKSE